MKKNFRMSGKTWHLGWGGGGGGGNTPGYLVALKCSLCHY